LYAVSKRPIEDSFFEGMREKFFLKKSSVARLLKKAPLEKEAFLW
jgi:hypothetical protein